MSRRKKNMNNFSKQTEKLNKNISMYRNHGASQVKTVFKDLKDEIHSPDIDIGKAKNINVPCKRNV